MIKKELNYQIYQKIGLKLIFWDNYSKNV
jgi:hypothetical protein